MRVVAGLVFLWGCMQLCGAAPVYPHMRGVNIGGWMLIEQFINPTLVNDSRISCEWTYGQLAKTDPRMVEAMEEHWRTWITEEEVARIAEVGLTHVRLPIGYWIVMTQEELDSYNEPFITGGWPYVEESMKWFKKYNVHVLMDLHGVPGSQNGWDNSGKLTTNVRWGTGDTIDRTLTYIDRITQRIAAWEEDPDRRGVVTGFNPVNEPFTPGLTGGIGMLKDFYLRVYPVIRKNLPASKYYITLDAGFNEGTWQNFMAGPEYENVALDMHLYHCFDPALVVMSYPEHLNLACNVHPPTRIYRQTLPTIVGEWSVAYKLDSYWADKEPFPDTPEQIAFMREFAISQMKMYGSFFFWTWKTETAPMWDYVKGVDNGWIPAVIPPEEEACIGQVVPIPTDYVESTTESTFTTMETSSTTSEETSSSSSSTIEPSTSSSSSEEESSTTSESSSSSSSIPDTSTSSRTEWIRTDNDNISDSSAITRMPWPSFTALLLSASILLK